MFEFLVRQREMQESGRLCVKYTCTICGYHSRKKDHATDHMINKHSVPENIPCEFCGTILETRTKYRYHRKKCIKNQKFKIN